MADVLAFGAHPDDLEIGCGGTLALLAAQGREVVMVDFTRGEMGTRGSVAERAAEADAAARVLGAKARVNLALPDGFLPFADPASGVAARELAVGKVVDLIRAHRPRLLLANFPSDAHPDHVIVGEVVKQARYLAGLEKWRPSAPRHRPELLLQYFEHEQLAASFVVDVSAVFEKKVAAIRCHKSQLFDPARAEPQTHLSRPDWLDKRIARDRWFGTQAGCDYGEPFFVQGMARIADPMALLP